MTVRRLLAELDSRELSEWLAYEAHAGPLGGARIDALNAMLSATIVNAAGPKTPAKPVDFMPQWTPRPTQTWQEQLAIVQQIHAALTGEVAERS